jgi:hypothetical protein
MREKALITADSKKGRRIIDLMRVELTRRNLTEKEAQAIIEHGGEFQNLLCPAFDEVKRLDHNARGIYPRGYSVKSIYEQARVLREYFSTVKYVMRGLPVPILPGGTEGWFAIPDWHVIGITYNDAVSAVIEALDCRLHGKFINFLDEKQLGSKYLREYPRKQKFFAKVAQQQKEHDVNIWLIPAQFGIRFRGDSSRRAALLMEQFKCEYPLGVFEIGVMLLTHPERLRGENPLFINCAGDAFSLNGRKDEFYSSLQFGSSCHMLSLGETAENRGHNLNSVPSAWCVRSEIEQH